MAKRKNSPQVVDTTPQSEEIVDVDLVDEFSDSYLQYAFSVIKSRAIPDVRDGLKPVHRRILWTMYKMHLKPTAGFVKSAKVVGECFTKGTLVHTLTGLQPIEELQAGSLVYTKNNKITPVIQAYENPPSELIRLTFSNGLTLDVTPGQLFRSVSKSGSQAWTKAEDLLDKRVLSYVHTTTFSLSHVPAETVIRDEAERITENLENPRLAIQPKFLSSTARQKALLQALMDNLKFNTSRFASLTLVRQLHAMAASLNLPLQSEAIHGKYHVWLPDNPTLKKSGHTVTVVDIEPIAPKPTYDIQVQDRSHQFFVHGIAVHNCMGNYHPHGDAAIYESLVRLTQDFSLNIPLVTGHGNFGNQSDPSFAASRYTECRLSPAGLSLLDDIDKDTVKLVDNYTGDLPEPTVLPTSFPNLLVNGVEGIAVGIATSIPGHNLVEVTNALIWLLNHKKGLAQNLPAKELAALQKGILEFIKGPDFPTAGQIINKKDLPELYKTGQGEVIVRAQYTVLDLKPRQRYREVIVTSLPYGVGPETVLERISLLVKEKKIPGLGYPTDVTDLDSGLRISIPIQVALHPDQVMEKLFRLTPLETKIKANMIALDGTNPRLFSLLDLCQFFLIHQEEVLTKKLTYEKEQYEKRLHLVAGTIKVLTDLEKVLTIIKSSRTADAAKKALKASEPTGFGLDEVQATYVLEQPIKRLVRLEIDELKKEQKTLQANIKECAATLANTSAGQKRRKNTLIKNLETLADTLGEPRKTQIRNAPTKTPSAVEEPTSTLQTSPPQELQVTVDHCLQVIYDEKTKTSGLPLLQRLSYGKPTKVKCLTNRGRIYDLVQGLSMLPATSTLNTGRLNLSGFLHLEKDEVVVRITSDAVEKDLLILTSDGKLKRITNTEITKTTKQGMSYIKLTPGNSVVTIITDTPELLIVSKKAQVLAVPSKEVPAQGLNSAGVQGIKLAKDDLAVSLSPYDKNAQVVSYTNKGYLQTVSLEEFSIKHRATMGMRLQLLHAADHILAAFTTTTPLQINKIAQATKDIKLQGQVKIPNISKRATKPKGPVITALLGLAFTN